MTEHAMIFDIGGESALGIVHGGKPDARLGVVVVVGGPQYRVGSHRQFVLLARHLADQGIPVLRFDYRGMGDASGAQRDFEYVGSDIAAAIDAFARHNPHLREFVLWGLCDAASAALQYAWRDPRVVGLALANPWVRTQEGLAKAYLKHYYLKRLVSRDFWVRLLGGRLNPISSLKSILGMLGKAANKAAPSQTTVSRSFTTTPGALAAGEPLPVRMAAGWRRFGGPILVVLSGDDLTAAEFRDTVARSDAWKGLLTQSRVTLRELPDATHTFSRREWRDQVSRWTVEWLQQITESPPGRSSTP